MPCIVRQATPADAAQLLELFARLDSETEQMLFEPNEREATLAQQQAILESFQSDKRAIYLVAEAEGVVGFCVLVPGKPKRIQHMASLVIGVRRASWSRGVGTALLEQALRKAHENDITRIELAVRADNAPAIALYRKFGFAVEGERKSSLLVDGQPRDELYMARVEQ